MGRLIRVAVCLLVFPAQLFSGSFGIGKYAGEFMAIGVGGRALGLGSAYVALAQDVTAGYWNPAGLSHITYPEIILMHDERFGSLINYDYGAVAIPYGTSASFAVSVIRLGIDGIPDTRNALIDHSEGNLLDGDWRLDYDRISFFNAADWAIYATYSHRHSERFSYGFNLKIIRRDIGEYYANGIGFDVGIWYNPVQRLYLGANAQDLTTTLVAWNTGTNELISPTLKVGGAYVLDIWGGRIIPVFDIDIRFENRQYASQANIGPVSFDFHGGLEYGFRNLFALRIGYNDLGQFTLGAGVHLPKLDIDYSFAKFDAVDQLGNTHRISLRLTLEEERFRRK